MQGYPACKFAEQRRVRWCIVNKHTVAPAAMADNTCAVSSRNNSMCLLKHAHRTNEELDGFILCVCFVDFSRGCGLIWIVVDRSRPTDNR